MPASVRNNDYRIFAAIIALLAWATLILQYFLKTGSSINFFSFFTIQSNILVALVTSSAILTPHSAPAKLLSGTSIRTAVALYIMVVSLVYNTVLRGLVPLAGLGLLADTMLHVIIPILYLIYWILATRFKTLSYHKGLAWLIFPFAYLIYSLIRGAMVGWYPYPFLNAGQLGYEKVMLNVVGMILVFPFAGLLLIAGLRNRYKRQH